MIAVVGASEALFILMSALVRPGDHVVALWPAYQSLYDLARAQGAEVELVELRPEDGWALDLDRIAAAMRPETRAVVVNLPHNPTGMHVSEAVFDELVELVDRHGATLVCDEVYRGLEHDPAARLPAAADRSPRAVSVGVLSKSYALAGLRVGWLATRTATCWTPSAQVRDYTSLCSPAPSEVLGIIALRAADALLERSRGIIAANLPILDELFAAHAERDRVGAADAPGRSASRATSATRASTRSTSASCGSRAYCSCPGASTTTAAGASGWASGGRTCRRRSSGSTASCECERRTTGSARPMRSPAAPTRASSAASPTRSAMRARSSTWARAPAPTSLATARSSPSSRRP